MIGDVSHATEIFTPLIRAQIRMVIDGRRKLVKHNGKLCSGCYGILPSLRIDPYCRLCRRAYMANRRKSA